MGRWIRKGGCTREEREEDIREGRDRDEKVELV
jgi:hypothetical protein